MKHLSIKKYKGFKLALICMIGLSLAFICIIAISLILIFSTSHKDRITKLVNKNQAFLNECIENKDYDKIYDMKGIKSITPYSLSDDELYIDFYCYGFGIVSSSIYYGFYYSSNDEPVAYQATQMQLEPDGDGWKWQQLNGDNHYYTEKIANNWYYYKVGF